MKKILISTCLFFCALSCLHAADAPPPTRTPNYDTRVQQPADDMSDCTSFDDEDADAVLYSGYDFKKGDVKKFSGVDFSASPAVDLQGKIAKLFRAQFSDKCYLLAIVTLDSGDNILLSLGRISKEKHLNEGDKIKISGFKQVVSGTTLVRAAKVTKADGTVIQINDANDKPASGGDQ